MSREKKGLHLSALDANNSTYFLVNPNTVLDRSLAVKGVLRAMDTLERKYKSGSRAELFFLVARKEDLIFSEHHFAKKIRGNT